MALPPEGGRFQRMEDYGYKLGQMHGPDKAHAVSTTRAIDDLDTEARQDGFQKGVSFGSIEVRREYGVAAI